MAKYCPSCSGFGSMEVPKMDGYGNIVRMVEIDCHDCSGTGELEILSPEDFFNDSWKDAAA